MGQGADGRRPARRQWLHPPTRLPDEPGARATVNSTAAPLIPSDRPLAIFCDFDGTFSVQDVGSTLAQQQLPEKRARLWARFDEGEFTAWSYVMALLDGFEFPEKDLERFLETIDR